MIRERLLGRSWSVDWPRTSVLATVIIATEIAKCVVDIIFVASRYPFDLSRWMQQIYPPWQKTDPPAPYGLPWYLLYYPGRAGFTALVIWLGLAETIVMLVLLKKGNRRLLYLYMGTSSLFFFWAIFDLWLLMLIVLSARWQLSLVLAAVVKLPLGAPYWVWEFIWKASLAAPGNWLHYVVIGAWWFGMLYYTRPRVIGLQEPPMRH